MLLVVMVFFASFLLTLPGKGKYSHPLFHGLLHAIPEHTAVFPHIPMYASLRDGNEPI